jgi:hypothetical protein
LDPKYILTTVGFLAKRPVFNTVSFLLEVKFAPRGELGPPGVNFDPLGEYEHTLLFRR